MKILFFGDVFAKPGRMALKAAIRKVTLTHEIDFIVVNGENMAHGKGISPEMAQEFFDFGVDVITTGNHAWDQSIIIPYFDQEPRLLRPANYSKMARTPGHGSVVVRSEKKPHLKLGVLQVMGRVFMDPLECPFEVAEHEVQNMKAQGLTNILIDFHGEATSEKQAFAHYMDGKVAAVVGTHAHVQTADERILPGGTAAITDVGMTGCYDSVIGIKKELSIQKFLSKRPVRYEPADGHGGYGCVVIEVDERTGKSSSILRLREATIDY